MKEKACSPVDHCLLNGENSTDQNEEYQDEPTSQSRVWNFQSEMFRLWRHVPKLKIRSPGRCRDSNKHSIDPLIVEDRLDENSCFAFLFLR